ncbi:MAG: alcohol dehydrogenase catalytic domain-containing protein [Planctomycetota bacterium]
MKIAYFTALRRIELADGPEAMLNRAEDVRLRIDRVGICGSDVHYHTHGRIGRQVVAYPATLGHECAGEVLEVGAGVEKLRPGDRVAIDPAISCGECDQCLRGRPHTCRRLRFMGCPGEAPGAVAERYVLPAENCYRIPESMSLDEAALCEPLSVGLHAVRLAGLEAIESKSQIVVFGAGPIGLSVLLCLRATADCCVHVIEPLAPRRALALKLGAEAAFGLADQSARETMRLFAPNGIDVVFECSGDPTCVDQAQELLTPGGMLVLVGIPESEQVSFDAHVMRRKELTFRNVRRQNGCVQPVIDMIAAGKLDARPLLTHRFGLDRIEEAFELVAGYGDGVVKAMLEL